MTGWGALEMTMALEMTNGVLGMTGRKGPIFILKISLFVEDFWA